MTHNGLQDQVLSCLSGLLVASRRYTLIFDQHRDTTVFLSMKKALVKDVSKYVERVDKRMPLCYLLVFEHFEGILILDDIIDYKLKANGVILLFEGYNLEIYAEDN